MARGIWSCGAGPAAGLNPGRAAGGPGRAGGPGWRAGELGGGAGRAGRGWLAVAGGSACSAGMAWCGSPTVRCESCSDWPDCPAWLGTVGPNSASAPSSSWPRSRRPAARCAALQYLRAGLPGTCSIITSHPGKAHWRTDMFPRSLAPHTATDYTLISWPPAGTCARHRAVLALAHEPFAPGRQSIRRG
ncbi:MAG TPA: hypothetical protein VGM60_15260 [Pseudonocardia sp.]|uniref:hypothetical protein n=1 Tax=Pseudonocardia sp. TaxID=60912 RepID=UPI002F41FAD6